MRKLLCLALFAALLVPGAARDAYGYGHGGRAVVVHRAPVVRPGRVVVRPGPVVRPAPVVVRPGPVVRPGVVVGRPREHVVLPSDVGLGHVAGPGRVVVRRPGPAHFTRPLPPAVLAARGAAVRGAFYHHDVFRPAWWRGRPLAWRAPASWEAHRLWRWATWPVLLGWFGWGSVPPIYYDYGTNIVYQDGGVYDGSGQQIATAPVYYQQAYALAQAAPAAKGPGDDWQSLGVWALVQGDQSDTSQIFQLAVNKAGVIRGNYVNALTNTTLPVRGTVDQRTLRAAWTVGDNRTTVYEAGIYNLTQDEAPVLVHVGADHTEQWLLVRIRESDAGAGPTTPPPPPAPAPAPGG